MEQVTINFEAGYAEAYPSLREFVAAQQNMAQMMKRMEKLSLPDLKGVA